eukprot:11206512-Lingulodinium_polyedra.AAC.1
MPIQNKAPAPEVKPEWLSWVCALRQTLRSAVLIFMRPGGGNDAMKLLYCKQQPHEFHGLLLQRCEAFQVGETDSVPLTQELWGRTFKYNWEYKEVKLTTWREGQDFQIQDVVVVMHTAFQFPDRVVSNDDPTTLQLVIENADYPLKPKKENDQDLTRHTKKRRKEDQDFRTEFQEATGTEEKPEETEEGAAASRSKALKELMEPEDSDPEDGSDLGAEDVALEAAFA